MAARHTRRQRDREHVTVVGAARDDDARRSGGPGRAGQHVQPVGRLAEDVGEVGPEQDAQVLAEVVRPLHRDAGKVADGAAVAVGTDEVARPLTVAIVPVARSRIVAVTPAASWSKVTSSVEKRISPISSDR